MCCRYTSPVSGAPVGTQRSGSDGEKEAGDCGYAAFAALTQTVKAYMEQASADVVIPAGFEPGITGLRILRPIRLDEGTVAVPTGLEPAIS